MRSLLISEDLKTCSSNYFPISLSKSKHVSINQQLQTFASYSVTACSFVAKYSEQHCNVIIHTVSTRYSNHTSPATITENNPHKDLNQQYTTRGHSTDLILQNNNVGHLFYLSGDLSHCWLYSLLKTPYNKYKSLQTTVTTNTSTVSWLTMVLPPH